MAVYSKVEQRPAPSNTKGLVHWLRDNLFSTPLNVALTVLGIAILFWVIPPFVKWAYVDANFIGTTREDCNSGGACWVFIRMKIDMFMYGFYPSIERWRINTVYGLFFVLVALFKYLKNPIIKIYFKEDDDTQKIYIEDNTGGIEQSIVDKIFSPYFSTKTNKNGSGLGLYICKTILKRDNLGDIDLKVIDNGTQFIITIN